jgi:cold shock CspA family protein
MAHQNKVYRGSSRLCFCNCGQRKNPRRYFAAGHNMDAKVRQLHKSPERDRPASRVASWTPKPDQFYSAVVDKVLVNKALRGCYFAILQEVQGERVFVRSDEVGPQGLQVGDKVSLRLVPGRDGNSARWRASECRVISEPNSTAVAA